MGKFVREALAWVWSVILASLFMGIVVSIIFFGGFLLAAIAAILSVLFIGALLVLLIKVYMESDDPTDPP
jgi:hypothetical protein